MEPHRHIVQNRRKHIGYFYVKNYASMCLSRIKYGTSRGSNKLVLFHPVVNQNNKHMPKILVVDDEKSHEDLITQRFTQKEFLRDHEFIFALDGIKALQLINDHPDIEIALLDINMPEMDGLTLLEKIRDSKPLLRVIMLSAYSDMNNIRSAMNLGAYDFVTKPIDMKDLELTIKRTMEEVKQLKETFRIHDESRMLK